MAFLGAPDTRPDEDYSIINSFPQLDHARRDWEATALVAWVLQGDPSTDDRAVAEAIRHRFGLRREDVVVSLHHPESFLLKFSCKQTRDRVCDAQKFHHEALEIHVRPWRSVSHTFSAAMFFRVHLCLEGLPVFAWTPEVVERIVSRKCSLHAIEGASTSREDTRTINLWAWTSNPSLIPKVAWVTFTLQEDVSRRPETSSHLPEKLKRGLTHRVIIHLDYIEDHTTAPLDDFISSADIAPYEPITSHLPWSLGVIDGMPEAKGEPSLLPPQASRQLEAVDDNLSDEDHRNPRGHRRPPHRSTHDDHLSSLAQRCKDNDDSDEPGTSSRVSPSVTAPG